MAKKTENDVVILNLKKQIEDKKKALKLTERFSPVTNCSIELDNIRLNLNVLTKEQLIALMVKLNMFRLSLIDLGIPNKEFLLSGFFRC